jgi:hypothetical protein
MTANSRRRRAMVVSPATVTRDGPRDGAPSGDRREDVRPTANAVR